METIHEYINKIKYLVEGLIGEWGLFAVIFLLGLASFGLGRLSALEDARPVISITSASESLSPPTINRGGEFVASKTGGVYYYPWCAGADKIPPEKQKWFQNEDDAQGAGYTAAKNCKGLQGLQSPTQ
jgi:hypothetical protein